MTVLKPRTAFCKFNTGVSKHVGVRYTSSLDEVTVTCLFESFVRLTC